MRLTTGVSVFLAAALAAAFHVRRSYVVVTVSGRSMSPTLHDGDRIVVRRRTADRLSRGDVVVLRPPDITGDYAPVVEGAWNVKRVAALPGQPVPAGVTRRDGQPAVDAVPAGSLVVLGDNPDGIDSRQRGFFPADRLLGVMVRRLGGERA
ncbi:signal peptidase I [Streptomyces sp. NBC_01304]|uniref:signal peptidase I n=1 Tax=Streptomyces sp. NBC_01304 TaxID=2903818 RepID=UPI002E10476F|nr:signal peptidase I [Streptomyces sp. NBC_01304]